jgi:hypothetical protein
MKISVFLVVLLYTQLAFAYEATTKGAIEMALDAAVGRGDYESACRHAINLGSHLNITNQLTVADMKKIGRICSTVNGWI